MRNLAIPAAVAAVMASASVSAADVNLFISGASAQRTFWQNDLNANICKGNAMTTYKVVTESGPAPDNQASRCLAKAAGLPALPANINDGDRVTLYYSAELGSIWGIAPFLAGHNTSRLFVNPDSADCSGTNCTIASYNVAAETFVGKTGGTGDGLISQVPNIGVTDLEPAKWLNTNPQNWPSGFSGVGSQPSSLGSYGTASQVVNGQLFTVIVNSNSPLTAGGTKKNISTASARAIFTGKYKTWGQVPEVGGGDATNIVVCRRDRGSGTQVAASIYFGGKECGVPQAAAIVDVGSKGALNADPVINNSTADLAGCVGGDTGAIGFRSLGSAANTTILTLDDIEANAHNASAGMYPYAFDTFAFDNTGASSASAAAVSLWTALRNDARKASALPAELGSQGTDGQWVSSGGAKGNYALPVLGYGNTSNITNWKTTAQGPTALGYRGGESCATQKNANSAL